MSAFANAEKQKVSKSLQNATATLIEVNFWTNPEYIRNFDGSLNVDTLVSNLSLRFPNETIEPGKTLLFFDEIEE